jgi:O-antigen ligase
MILLIGSRGAIFCLLSFFLIKYLLSKKTVFFKIIRLILIALTLSIIYFNLGTINNLLITNFNIHSRTLTSFSNKESDQFYNRTPAWLAAINLIEEKPLFGYGLGGDYYPISKLSVLIDNRYGASSPHNGFLQLMMFFGIPIGLFFGLWLFFSILKIRKNYSYHHRELLIITFSIFIIPSMTIGDGIFIKPGVALYIYMILKYNSKNTFNDSVNIKKTTQYETSM